MAIESSSRKAPRQVPGHDFSRALTSAEFEGATERKRRSAVSVPKRSLLRLGLRSWWLDHRRLRRLLLRRFLGWRAFVIVNHFAWDVGLRRRGLRPHAHKFGNFQRDQTHYVIRELPTCSV